LERENGRLSERLALIAPAESPGASNLTRDTSAPTLTPPSQTFSWRSARWLVVLALIVVAIVAAVWLVVLR
jgi:hypothetical protein